MAVSPYISLFSGVGGLDLALKVAAPEAQCVCHVEGDLQAANILAARMQDGSLDEAPIWSDVRTFDGKPFSGKVDGIIGGFPCQDLSLAGKRAGIHGTKSGLWFEYVRIIREVQPRWCFIENVPAVLAFPAGGVVLGELAGLGFDAEWGTLRAAEVGASHGRKRSFILAYSRRRASKQGWLTASRQAISGRSHVGSSGPSGVLDEPTSARAELAFTSGIGQHEGWPESAWQQGRTDAAECRGTVDDTATAGRCSGESESHRSLRNEARGQESDGRRDGMADAQRIGSQRWGNTGKLESQAATEPCQACEWQRDGYSIDDSQHFLADTSSPRLQERRSERRNLWQELQAAQRGGLPLFAPGPSDERWPSYIARFPQLSPALSSFDRRLLAARCVGLLPFGVPCTPEELGRVVAQAIAAKEVERDVWRVAHELAFGLDEFSRVDQLRGIGNGVVAIQGAAMFTVLSRRAGLRF